MNVNQPLAAKSTSMESGYRSSWFPELREESLGRWSVVGAERGVVAPSITIAVNKLTSMFWECVFAVRPSIVVLIWTAKGAALGGRAVGVRTRITIGAGRVVPVRIAVTVVPLRVVGWPEVMVVAHAIAVPVNASKPVDGGGADRRRAHVWLCPVGIVAVTVAVAIGPLGGLTEEVVVRIGGAIAVFVNAAKSVNMRTSCIRWTNIGLETGGVVAKSVAVAVNPLCWVERKGISTV